MTSDKHEEVQVRLSNAETKATRLTTADTNYEANQLESECYSITSNEQKRCKNKLSIHSSEFEVW